MLLNVQKNLFYVSHTLSLAPASLQTRSGIQNGVCRFPKCKWTAYVSKGQVFGVGVWHCLGYEIFESPKVLSSPLSLTCSVTKWLQYTLLCHCVKTCEKRFIHFYFFLFCDNGNTLKV